MKAFLSFLFLVAPLSGRAAELRVAAAASLAEAITEVAAAFQKEHGIKVTPVFAGSNVLARQIEEGAPVDVFLSADQPTMDKLSKAGLVRDATSLLTNSLVIVAPADSGLKFSAPADFAGLKRIAIGDPAAVPAGIYAKAWLTKAGLWEKVGPRCIGAENVRAALATVESGNVDAAIVYKTDAVIAKKTKVVWTVPDGEAPAIVYPVAVCSATRQADAAKHFTDFLQSADAGKIFTARGFGLVEK